MASGAHGLASKMAIMPVFDAIIVFKTFFWEKDLLLLMSCYSITKEK